MVKAKYVTSFVTIVSFVNANTATIIVTVHPLSKN